MSSAFVGLARLFQDSNASMGTVSTHGEKGMWDEWKLRKKKKKKGDLVTGRRIEKSHLSVSTFFSFVQYTRRNHPEGRKIMTIYKLTV